MIKKTSLTVLAAWVVLVAFTLYKRPVQAKHEDNRGFDVVELFTSEGCSSCPPADALIARIAKETSGQQVYILAYHVDYWNRLGWKDAFSKPEYSKRQSRYADWLNLGSVYTPQIVVNGNTELIGSDQSKLQRAIGAGLMRAPDHKLTLSLAKGEGQKININYQIGGKTAGLDLVLASIRPAAVSKVASGENAGHTLSHVQIVSGLQVFPLNGKTGGTVPISLPGQQGTGGELIAFLQEAKTGKIRAASKTILL